MTKLEKVTVWSSTVAVAATGLVYAWMKYLLQPTEPFAVVNHPLQPVVLKLHIITAPFLVFGVGMIAVRHIWPHFRAGLKKGRRSGISGLLLFVPMVATGYALQVLSSTEWLRVVGLVHFALGTIFAIGALFHFLATRRALRVSRGAVSAGDRTYERTGT